MVIARRRGECPRAWDEGPSVDELFRVWKLRSPPVDFGASGVCPVRLGCTGFRWRRALLDVRGLWSYGRLRVCDLRVVSTFGWRNRGVSMLRCGGEKNHDTVEFSLAARYVRSLRCAVNSRWRCRPMRLTKRTGPDVRVAGSPLRQHVVVPSSVDHELRCVRCHEGFLSLPVSGSTSL